jgi:translation initiation factor IF-3
VFAKFILIIRSVVNIINNNGNNRQNPKKHAQMNEDIRDREVRVVGDDGSQLGIMSSKDALKLAIQKNLDLVKIAPNANPPVCKILDYAKYLFEEQKREKEVRKKQKIVELKEIRLKPNIGTGDFDTKVNQALKFLQSGCKLKAWVKFEKRQFAHPELGIELLVKFCGVVAEFGVPEAAPKMDGKFPFVIINPKKDIKDNKENT